MEQDDTMTKTLPALAVGALALGLALAPVAALATTDDAPTALAAQRADEIELIEDYQLPTLASEADADEPGESTATTGRTTETRAQTGTTWQDAAPVAAAFLLLGAGIRLASLLEKRRTR